MAGQGNIVVVDEKRRRSTLRTRIAMDFDLKSSTLHSQEDVDEYLERHHGPLPSGIKVEWCNPGTDDKVSPPNGGVYLHPQIQALDV